MTAQENAPRGGSRCRVGCDGEGGGGSRLGTSSGKCVPDTAECGRLSLPSRVDARGRVLICGTLRGFCLLSPWQGFSVG